MQAGHAWRKEDPFIKEVIKGNSDEKISLDHAYDRRTVSKNILSQWSQLYNGKKLQNIKKDGGKSVWMADPKGLNPQKKKKNYNLNYFLEFKKDNLS